MQHLCYEAFHAVDNLRVNFGHPSSLSIFNIGPAGFFMFASGRKAEVLSVDIYTLRRGVMCKTYISAFFNQEVKTKKSCLDGNSR